jgi:hypothetical protein
MSGSQTVDLPQWDPALFPGQKLTDVLLTNAATVSAHITHENNLATQGLLGVNVSSQLKAAFLTMTTQNNYTLQTDIYFASPSDGVPGSGPDFHDYGVISKSNTQAGTDFDHDVFIGNAILPASVVGQHGTTVAQNAPVSGANSTITVTDYTASGTLSVTYTYSPVPEHRR